jgi:hypothetical protein
MYENKLFYVERLEDDELVLKSNDGNVLILPVEDGSLGDSITEIVVLYKPLHNFSVQNRLFKTQWVEVSFEDQTVKGQIVKADNVIEILLLDGEMVYIPVDRGLPKDVEIKKISRPHKEERKAVEEVELDDSPNFNEPIGYIEEEEDVNVQYFYSIEQQTSDLLEHLMMYIPEVDNTPKLRSKMFKMIQRYKELRTKYTNFDKGIHLNRLPPDQLNATVMQMKTRMYAPVSKDIVVKNYTMESEAIGDYFRKVESEEDESPFLTEIRQIIDDINRDTKFYDKNKAMEEVARNHDFKTMAKRRLQFTPVPIQDVFLYEMPNLLIPLTKISVMKEKGKTWNVKLGERKRYMTRVDKTFLINSVMMPPVDYIKYSKVYDLRSSILDKINLNQNQYYSVFYKGKQIVVNKTKKEIALLNKYTYYENHSATFESYMKHIIPNFKSIIRSGMDADIIHPFYNFDQFMNEMSVTNINELKNSEFITASAYLKSFVTELLVKFKRDELAVPILHRFVNTSITNNFTLLYKELMPKELLNVYFSSSELFKIGEIDNYQYYKSNFIKDQTKLDITDAEIKEILDEIKKRIQEPVEEKIAIVYKTEEERIQDRVLLKQVDKRSGMEHIFKLLIERGIDIRMDDLVTLVMRFIQSGYKSQKGMNRVQTEVFRIVNELKIMEGDKVYVEESKRTYQWNKKWTDPEQDPTCMIKRKLLKGDCGTLEKETEYNDRIARLVFDIEQDKRRERELGTMNLELVSENVRAKLASLNSRKMKSELKYNEEKRVYDVLERQKDANDQASSPYIKLRDKILSEPDMNLKYRAMQLFIQKYTKRGDDVNWFYCIETGVKLIPIFFNKLADAFLRTNNYEVVVDMICKEQGTLSDNGDKWVDKYSGYIIKDINFEEEYGLETVDVEKDKPIFDELVVEELQLQREINQNLKSLMFYLGIYPDETDLYPRIMKTYNSVSKGATKDSELIPIRLLCIMAHILVQVQTHDMKFSKPFPNCKFSFEGYPLTDDSNLSGIAYIVCVVLKLSKTAPWNVFSKTTDEKLIKNLKSLLERFVVPMLEVEELLSKRRIGIRKKEDVITTVWKNFSPRLKRFSPIAYEVRKVETKYDYLDRVYYFSYILQGIIHKHVSEQEFLLKDSQSVPFLINTCCNTNNNVFRYFVANAGLKDLLSEINGLSREVHKYTRMLLGTKAYFVENTRMPTSEPSSAYDEKTIQLKLISWEYSQQEIFKRFSLEFPQFNKTDSVDKKLEKLREQGITASQDTFIQMLKAATTIINIPVKKEKDKMKDDEITKWLDSPKLNDYLYRETEDLLDRIKGDKTLDKVLLFNRTCKREKMNLVISYKIEHYTHMNEILYNKINALLHIFPEMVATDKTSMSKVVKKHWLLADSHMTDIADTVNAYYNGVLSLPHDERFKRDIASIPLDRYENLMNIKLNQESMNLLYHYIFVHIIHDYKTAKNKNVDVYLKAIIKLFESEDKVLNYDTQSTEYETKLSKKSETQIKTDYFKNLSLEERRSENIMKEHKLDKWGVGLQKSMFKYDKSTYGRDKQSAQEVINGLATAPESLDEEEPVEEEEGYDTKEPYEDDDDAEYEEED